MKFPIYLNRRVFVMIWPISICRIFRRYVYNYSRSVCPVLMYSKTCVRQPPLKLTLAVDVERWLSYKGTCNVILLAKLHDMYLYQTDNFFHINHYLKSVSKVALLHRFYCTLFEKVHLYDKAYTGKQLTPPAKRLNQLRLSIVLLLHLLLSYINGG